MCENRPCIKISEYYLFISKHHWIYFNSLAVNQNMEPIPLKDMER